MTNDTGRLQEAVWPEPKHEHLRALLTQGCQEVEIPTRKRAGRRPLVCWNHLCLAILLCFLQGWDAQLQVWRLISTEWLGEYAPVRVCDQAIYNRLQRAAPIMQHLFEQVSGWLRTRLAPWEDRRLAPWATGVYAVDASTLDRLARFLPWLRALKATDKGGLAGQISAVFDVRRQQWVRVECVADAAANCKELFFPVLDRMQAGALLLFDRGYLSFPLFDTLSGGGLWWITRYGNQIGYRVVHVCYQGDNVLDAIVSLGTSSASQAQHPVRLIQFWWQGKQYRYLSNVLNPHTLSLEQVVRLYARRWDIELAFRALKDHLNLHHLWSAKWSVIQVQLWCALLLAQVYHALQVEIAGQSGGEVFEVSLDLLIRLTPGWLARGLTPLEQAVRFGRELGLIRPSTRHRSEVPWVDPAWVEPPPREAIQPRAKATYRPPHRKDARKQPAGTSAPPRVRLKGGTLHLLE